MKSVRIGGGRNVPENAFKIYARIENPRKDKSIQILLMKIIRIMATTFGKISMVLANYLEEWKIDERRKTI